MTPKRTTLEVLEAIERNSVDSLRIGRDTRDISIELLQRAKATDDSSAEVNIGGLRASITKEFWNKYGKWILGAIALTGWGSKLVSLFKHGG